MYRYLSVVSADTDDIVLSPLNIRPQKDMVEEGNKAQKIRYADDDSEERISLGTVTVFYITILWSLLTDAEADLIKDYYYNPLKGNHKVRTFPWVHPIDGRIYVVRFDSKMSKKTSTGKKRSISNVKLKVMGLYQ